MAPPQVSFLQRGVTYPDGSLHFEVTASIVDKGTVLPFIELFVLSIPDPLNPRADVLARIATPHDLRVEADAVYVKADSSDVRTISGDTFLKVASVDELTTLARDRVTAVRRGSNVYLAPTISLVYDRLSTADAASRQLVDRLSKLVTDYSSFYGLFRTDPATVYSLPVTSRAVEVEYTAAYTAKRDARIAAEAARDAALLARDACRAGDAALQAKIDMLISDVAHLEAARIVVSAMDEVSVPPTVAVDGSELVKTFVLNGADARSYEALLVAKRDALAAFRATLAERGVQCSAFGQALADAEATVNAARNAENDALRALYAVCPTFNPSTV